MIESFDNLSEEERAKLAFDLKQEAQIRIIKYQLLLRLIDDPLQYEESAELFNLLINRAITISKDFSWHKEREKVQELIAGKARNVISKSA